MSFYDFSQPPAEKKTCQNRASKQMFGPSYFVRALLNVHSRRNPIGNLNPGVRVIVINCFLCLFRDGGAKANPDPL